MDINVEKRKRQGNGEANCKRVKPPHDDGVLAPAPALARDEEVDEFFAILKRIQVAVKYFQRRDGGRCTDGESTAKPPWRPSFEREDFVGVKKEPKSPEENQKAYLDLNSDPVSDDSDSV